MKGEQKNWNLPRHGNHLVTALSQCWVTTKYDKTLEKSSLSITLFSAKITEQVGIPNKRK